MGSRRTVDGVDGVEGVVKQFKYLKFPGCPHCPPCTQTHICDRESRRRGDSESLIISVGQFFEFYTPTNEVFLVPFRTQNTDLKSDSQGDFSSLNESRITADDYRSTHRRKSPMRGSTRPGTQQALKDDRQDSKKLFSEPLALLVVQIDVFLVIFLRVWISLDLVLSGLNGWGLL